MRHVKRSRYTQYLLFEACILNSLIFLDNSWSLNAFCLVCWLAQISQKSSGSLQVLQKYVAVISRSSFKHGSHFISSSFFESTLKRNVNHKMLFDSLCTLKQKINILQWNVHASVLKILSKWKEYKLPLTLPV